MRWRRIGVPLLGLLGGCAVGPNYHSPKPDAPPAFAAVAATATGEHADRSRSLVGIL